jgi:voltage-gated potassium channel
MTAWARFRAVVEWWQTPAVIMIGLLVVYFAVPLGDRGGFALWVGLLASIAAVGGVGFTFYLHISRFARGEEQGLTVKELLILLEILLVVFSASYFIIARDNAAEFSGMNTRLDALYFSLTTFATVGFGDIYAKSQLARALVSVQMLFDLVFVGALVSITTSGIKLRFAAGPLPSPPETRESTPGKSKES